MSKRRLCLTPKTYSVNYVDVSPSKKRTLHKKVLPLNRDVYKGSPVVTSDSLQGTGIGDASTSTVSDSVHDSPVSFEYTGSSSDIQDETASTYAQRQQKAADHWSEVRADVLRAAVESVAFPYSGVICVVCEQPAVAVCYDCGPRAYFCDQHIEVLHHKINMFHIPQVFKNGLLQPYTFSQPRYLPVRPHSCPLSMTYSKEVVCVDGKGFQHLIVVGFCTCEPEAVTLVRENLWPATPKGPTLAFHSDLLLLLDSLVLEGCIGVDAFCRALDVRRGKVISPQLRKVYPIIIEVFEEYRFYRYQIESLRFLSPDLDNTAVCPACPKDGMKILSADAMFGLCRKKSSGASVRPPLFSDLFFEPQANVDEFVSTYDSASQILDKGCHDFLAGNALRSKTRYASLDETAVFGSVCRHQYPQRFFSMKHGERLAYPVYMLENLKKTHGDQHLLFLYDIACLLETHLKNHGRVDLLHQTSFGIPIFHVYGHCAFCQLTYSPRNMDGCGLTDGEGTERLWSYLRRFAKSTKEMRPSHRIDVITSALAHYAFKIRIKLDSSLCKRLKHCQDVKHQSEVELSKLLESSNGAITEDSIPELEQKQLSLFSRSHSTLIFGQRHKVLQDAISIARERKYLLCTKARYAEGQSIASRLAKKITTATTSLKRAVSRFNSMPRDILEGNAYVLPDKLEWETITDVEQLSAIEICSFAGSSTIQVPIAIWSKLIRVSNVIKRAQEEEDLVKQELCTLNSNLIDEHLSILQKIKVTKSAITEQYSDYLQGCLNLLHKHLLICEITLVNFSKNVSVYYTATLPKLEAVGDAEKEVHSSDKLIDDAAFEDYIHDSSSDEYDSDDNDNC